MLPWSRLPVVGKLAVVVAAVLELVLTVRAWRDLLHRPAAEVRGPKALWALIATVQPLGPPAYFRFGRRG